MHKVKLSNGREFQVMFTHNIETVYVMDDNGFDVIPGSTQCTIQDVHAEGEPFEEFVGMAICHQNDNFDRKVGRKLSFGRAIAGFTIPERTELWKWFLITFKYK
jgi:hypothetical protein